MKEVGEIQQFMFPHLQSFLSTKLQPLYIKTTRISLLAQRLFVACVVGSAASWEPSD